MSKIKLLIPLAAILAGVVGMFFGANYISPQDPVQKADVIVAVSGGDTEARTEKAVALYQAGWADQLIFSGAAQDPTSKPNAQAMSEIAQGMGVKPKNISLDKTSKSTVANAKNVSKMILEAKYKKVILVTSQYHQRRTYLAFRERLPELIEIINQPAPDASWSRTKWWYTPQGWFLTGIEFLKTGFMQMGLGVN